MTATFDERTSRRETDKSATMMRCNKMMKEGFATSLITSDAGMGPRISLRVVMVLYSTTVTASAVEQVVVEQANNLVSGMLLLLLSSLQSAKSIYKTSI